MFGSIPGLAELQARWVAHVFSGEAALPPTEEMQREVGYYAGCILLHTHGVLRLARIKKPPLAFMARGPWAVSQVL